LINSEDINVIPVPTEQNEADIDMANSYKYEIQVVNDEKFYKSSVAFATHDEAAEAGQAKYDAWPMARSYRVVESDDPPNYKWEGRLVPIEKPEPSQWAERYK
jgi:hypothetical protein